MGLDRRTDLHSTFDHCTASRATFLLFVVLCALSTYAQDFTVAKISRDQLLNRDPVISETGLAAWMYFDTNVANSAHSHISVYINGERNDLTEEVTSIYGAIKPNVQSNHLIFTANTRINDGSVTWTLVEVPTRDDGEHKELSATFSATEVGGEQTFLDSNLESESTNEAVVEVIGGRNK